MSVSAGQALSLRVEKPAAGGWMIARVEGQVLLVSGAIPGERVTARVERVGKGVAYARVVSVEEASPDRRDPFTDPMCGGCLYAHVSYARQLEMKGQVIGDAFARIGRIPLPGPVAVAESPDAGYRMRARLHVRGGRIGFFREGTHEICDARATRQLLPATSDVIDRLGAGLRSLGADAVRDVEISENMAASDRAVHLDAAVPIDPRPLAALGAADGVTGLTLGRETLAGVPFVVDALTIDGHALRMRRHVQAFFQGNRYLLGALAAHVVAHVSAGAQVVDLYAGVGLFAIAAAVVRGARVQAVEGDRIAARDLAENAKACGGLIDARHEAVEAWTSRLDRTPQVLIVDPPRTGLSREALDGAVAMRAPSVVYVSCDVATLARDARRFIDGGYTLARIDAFDLFPNTPHVETVVKFEM
jgi:23S rRNA (uracil1939-C5)-methyltransferase